jgi:hypothetical protein
LDGNVADELENSLKECGRYLNNILSWNLPVVTEEYRNHDSRSSGLDLNLNIGIKR